MKTTKHYKNGEWKLMSSFNQSNYITLFLWLLHSINFSNRVVQSSEADIFFLLNLFFFSEREFLSLFLSRVSMPNDFFFEMICKHLHMSLFRTNKRLFGICIRIVRGKEKNKSNSMKKGKNDFCSCSLLLLLSMSKYLNASGRTAPRRRKRMQSEKKAEIQTTNAIDNNWVLEPNEMSAHWSKARAHTDTPCRDDEKDWK